METFSFARRARVPRMLVAISRTRGHDSSVESRRREPTWVWYAIAFGLLLVLFLLDVLGVVDALGP